MAIWYDKLYSGEKAALMYEKIHKSVEEEKYIPGVYLITLGFNPKDQLDIFNCLSLYLPAMKRRLMPIIGIASGYEEAISLFRLIAEDVYEKTGKLALRRYFEEQLNANSVE